MAESGIAARVSGRVAGDLSGFAKILSGVGIKGHIAAGLKTIPGEGSKPFAMVKDSSGQDMQGGAISLKGNVIGTNLHGIFDEPEVVSKYIHYLKQLKSGAETEYIASTEKSIDINSFRQAQYDKWAGIVRQSLDIGEMYNIMAM